MSTNILYDIAREVTDEVFGEGAYDEINNLTKSEDKVTYRVDWRWSYKKGGHWKYFVSETGGPKVCTCKSLIHAEKICEALNK